MALNLEPATRWNAISADVLNMIRSSVTPADASRTGGSKKRPRKMSGQGGNFQGAGLFQTVNSTT
jgi:hypothetical protein